MGNCLNHRQAKWVDDDDDDDDWKFLSPPPESYSDDQNEEVEEENFLGRRSLLRASKGQLHGEGGGTYRSSPEIKIKIKITKKQLEELLRRDYQPDHSGGAGEALMDLVRAGAATAAVTRRTLHWIPSLESIPEDLVDETFPRSC